MERRLKAGLIIFDLDGTLIDSSGDIAWAANRTLEEMGYNVLALDVIKANIGWGVRKLLEQVMPEEPPERIDRAREVFFEYYGRHLLVETRLYPQALEVLSHFMERGKSLAIVTNKSQGHSERIMEGLGIQRFFQMVVGGDAVQNKKPHPEPVLMVMERLGAAAADTVFVGDSAVDCETGRRAGVMVIGAAYGFRGRDELIGAGCGLVIDRLTELEDIVI
ncbi:MAG: HAD-IA family hydrolase [Deltaproteobacteria bacterium]|nr:HAD-IA family hydrolase [Deltaproteobacteria bacterium]